MNIQYLDTYSMKIPLLFSRDRPGPFRLTKRRFLSNAPSAFIAASIAR
jgi:hypothetical protein